jgi:hypothetical protein
MADDLLTNIRAEIEARLRELEPSLDEYLELGAALAALSPDGAKPARAGAPRGRKAAPKRAGGRGGSARFGAVGAGTVRGGAVRAGTVRGGGGVPRAGAPGGAPARGKVAGDGASGGRPARPRVRGRPRSRGPRTHTDRAVLAALEHGSHTVAELLVVTGLPARDIRESLRLMRMQRAIVTTDREGKTAYALQGD